MSHGEKKTSGNTDDDIDWRGGYDDTNHRIQRRVCHVQESEFQRLGTPTPFHLPIHLLSAPTDHCV
jgi:hypothetical protein